MSVDTLVSSLGADDAFNVPTEADLVRREMATMLGLKDSLIESLRDRVRAVQSGHRSDIELIGSTLIDEAERRDWCAEYDTVVERLNDELQVSLPVREHEYTVTATYTVTINVMARDGSHADSVANDAFREIENTIDRGDWDGYSALSSLSSVDHYAYETSEA